MKVEIWNFPHFSVYTHVERAVEQCFTWNNIGFSIGQLLFTCLRTNDFITPSVPTNSEIISWIMGSCEAFRPMQDPAPCIWFSIKPESTGIFKQDQSDRFCYNDLEATRETRHTFHFWLFFDLISTGKVSRYRTLEFCVKSACELVGLYRISNTRPIKTDFTEVYTWQPKMKIGLFWCNFRR